MAVITGILLLAPLVAMQLTEEVSWGPGDFVVAGVLLFGAGMGMVVGVRQAKTTAARVAIVTSMAAGLVVVWAELAVGLRKADLESAFDAMTAKRVDGIVISADAVLTANSTPIADLALTHGLPTASAWWEFAESGGLLVYGANIYDLYSRSLRFVDRIFKGAKPSDLPVEQPTKFEFVTNLKTAKALGLAIPQSLLLRADEVIQWLRYFHRNGRPAITRSPTRMAGDELDVAGYRAVPLVPGAW